MPVVTGMYTSLSKGVLVISRRILAILLICAAGQHAAHSQDYKKVIEIVQRMEHRLTTMIAREERARKTADDQLRAEVGMPPRAEAAGTVAAAAPESHGTDPAADPLKRLHEGNRRFVEGQTAPRDFLHERPALATGQHPFVIVLTCSDSRVPPELLFDESLGQIFVVRDAGNVVDSVVLGSIEYAAEHLHAGTLVVLGHEACGAVNATIKGGEFPPNIASLVRRIETPVGMVKAKNLKGVKVDSVCIQENVRYQVAQVTAQSGLLRSMVEEGHLRIVGAVYSLTTGEVKFLEPVSAERATHSPTPGHTTAEKAKNDH